MTPSAHEPTREVYLLFAHEAYFPAPAQEVNTSLVAATSLLRPEVRQPDGARMYDCLARGRRPGEIVPLSTLTHELDGGARWPEVGDWEAVTTDLLQPCEAALSRHLPEIALAPVCVGPHSTVRACALAPGRCQTSGPTDRAQVLVDIARQLAWPQDLRPPEC
ncbi:hypothetical protein ACF08B_22355 [Streptomyces sp. NPDC015139]|uniref:hypothetical protein n=1 Tax=Streptomyces sp. NPDC015139 TaxID=3364942 RepID=UPI0037016FC5